MKKKHYIILGIVAIFIITNPSITAFKNYLGSSSYSGLKRTENFFVCSLYSHGGRKYFGIAGNFWEIPPPRPTEAYLRSLKQDSLRKSDSSMYSYLTNDSSYHVKDTVGKYKVLRLYYSLLNEGYTAANLGNFEQFESAVKDTTTATKIYMNLKKDGYTVKNLGSLDEFKRTFCKM